MPNMSLLKDCINLSLKLKSSIMVGMETFIFLSVCVLTPWIIFTSLFLKPTQPVHSPGKSTPGAKFTDDLLNRYFLEKMNRRIVLDIGHQKLIGYCLMSVNNGEITFHLQNHQPLVVVRKVSSGWYAQKPMQAIENGKLILNQLILHLEQTLYN